jgi:excisionase family DNA binding protein
MAADEYLTSEEVATKLKVSTVSVQNWCKTGDLVAVKAGRKWRIRPSDLEEFLRRKTEEAKSETKKVDGLAVCTY